MTYMLYGTRGSGSAAIEMALRVCGMDFKQVRASSWEPDSAIEELTRINPLRQIPTLVLPDGTVLTESVAILIHLGLMAPESGLLPSDPGARAQVLRGLVFIATNCYAPVLISDFPERWTTAISEPARDAVRQAARHQLYRSWQIFADTMPATPYLTGAAPGALDFLAVVVSKWSDARSHIAATHPRFVRVLEAIEAHEAIRAVVRAHWER
jgi:GST-like protein